MKDRISRLQRRLTVLLKRGIDDDGRIGPQTLGAIEEALGIGVAGANTVPGKLVKKATEKVDARSEKNIATLLPEARPFFRALVKEGKVIARRLGADDYVMIGGTRTYAEQDALYAQGRTAGGPRVTNARGGYSNHNFGVAGDFGVFGAGKTYLDAMSPTLAGKVHAAVAAWAKRNFPDDVEWGGDWKSFKDDPHFQIRTGLSLAQMRDRVSSGRPIM